MNHENGPSSFRFGLRTLLVSTTIICVSLALLITEAARYQTKKNSARSLIESVGGKITIFGNSPDPPPGQNLLTEFLGLSNYREQLWAVDLSDTQITAKQTQKLAGCDWIRILNLSGTKLGDEDLTFANELPKLEELQLNRTTFTDAVLKHLSSLERLLVLKSDESRVTVDGLIEFDETFDPPRFFADAKIAGMFPAKLRDGVVVETNIRPTLKLDDGFGSQTQANKIEFSDVEIVTNESFDLLKKLRSVSEVRGFSKTNQFELSNLFRDLTEVRSISFSGGAPSGPDIQDIAKLPRLKYLYLYSSDAMTDDDVRTLSQLKTVEVLALGSIHGSLHRAPLLSEFESLKVLSLSAHRWEKRRQLTDKELQHTIQLLQPLKELSNLHSLRIHGNDMQDEVLLSLIEFRHLKQIVVWMSEFLTKGAIEEFREARPDCEVLIDGKSSAISIN